MLSSILTNASYAYFYVDGSYPLSNCSASLHLFGQLLALVICNFCLFQLHLFNLLKVNFTNFTFNPTCPPKNAKILPPSTIMVVIEVPVIWFNFCIDRSIKFEHDAPEAIPPYINLS